MFEQLKNSKSPVLVTGATGFKGTWLCQLLDALAIDFVGIGLNDRENHFYSLNPLDDRIHILDMTDFYSLKSFMLSINPRHIIHMAASSLVLDSYKSPHLTFSNNFNSSLNLLEIVKENLDETKILITTTDKVYKPQLSREKFIESDPLWGQDPYSHSKVCVEALVDAYQKLREKPSLYVARAGNVIGGGDVNKDRLFSEIGMATVTGDKVVIRNPSHTRPFQHVLDVLFGYLHYLEAISLRRDIPLALNFANQQASLSVKEATKAYGLDESSLIFLDETNISKKENPILDLNSNLTSQVIGWSNIMSTKEAIELTKQWWEKIKLDPSASISTTQCNIKDYLEKL